MTREQQKEKTQFMQLVKKAAAKGALLVDGSYCLKCFSAIPDECRNNAGYRETGGDHQWCPTCYEFVSLIPKNF